MASPLIGTGIVPSGALGAELTDITRRAFIPNLVVQLYKASPTMAAFIANTMDADGGISSITVPVQGSSLTTHSWGGYSGSFSSPNQPTGIQDANFNLKLSMIPISMLGMESALQLNHAVVNKLSARVNDATNVGADAWSKALWSNSTNAQEIIGYPGAIDDGTNLAVYGGIDRTTNIWWKSYRKAAGSVAPTRNSVLENIMAVTQFSGGERPDFAVTGMGTWAQLAEDFTSLERYEITPAGTYANKNEGATSLFTALTVAGLPIFADPYAPEGQIIFQNTRYMGFYMHTQARFAFTGFHSLVPNLQLGYLGVVVTLLELVNAKPKASGVVTGYTYVTL